MKIEPDDDAKQHLECRSGRLIYRRGDENDFVGQISAALYRRRLFNFVIKRLKMETHLTGDQ